MLFIGFFFFLSLAYGTPETATQLTDWIEKVTHGTVIVKPIMDTPVMVHTSYCYASSHRREKEHEPHQAFF